MFVSAVRKSYSIGLENQAIFAVPDRILRGTGTEHFKATKPAESQEKWDRWEGTLSMTSNQKA
jgi:hypothetical protein